MAHPLARGLLSSLLDMIRKIQPYIIEAIGALLLLAFVLLPVDSLSESDNSDARDRMIRPESTGPDLPAPWIEIAERLETRRDYQAVLRLMDQVITRESGSAKAEARHWRALFAARRGLYEQAGAVLDSLVRESGPWTPGFQLAITEGAFDLALLRNDIDAARAALDLWTGSPGSVEDVSIDSLRADLNARFGTALLLADRNFFEAATCFELALNLGLPEAETDPIRFQFGVALSRADSTFRALDVLGALLDDAAFLAADPTLARRAMLEYADLLYRSGDYAESRRCYEAALSFVSTAADSGWVLVQLGDVLAQLGSDRAAHEFYARYLSRWPEGTWATWARTGTADLDTTAFSGDGSSNLDMKMEIEP